MILASNEVTLVKVDDGAKGDTGTSVSSMTTEFYLSTSKLTQTGGSWSTEMPTWSSGMYLWTRTKIVYSNPDSIEYTTPVCDSSWEASNESAKTATNYMNFDDNGLVVGNMMEEVLGKNVLIDSDSVDIRDGNTVLASFGANDLVLGRNSDASTINLCDGAGFIKSYVSSKPTSSYKREALEISSRDLCFPVKEQAAICADNYTSNSQNDLFKSHGSITCKPDMFAMEVSDENIEGTNVGSYAKFEFRTHTGVLDDGTASVYTVLSSHSYNDSAGTHKGSTLELYDTHSEFSGPIHIQGIEFTGANKVLWTGASLMNASDTITLSEAISSQANGIVLVWGFYQNGEVQTGNFNSYFVPKFMVEQYSATGHIMFMTTATGNYASNKALYIKDTEINGISYNDRASVTTNASIKVSPQNFALCRVIGV